MITRRAADRMLDRFDQALRKCSATNPWRGGSVPSLPLGYASFPVGNYVLFYLPLPNGIDLVRVRSGYMDIEPEDFDVSPD